MPYTVTPTALPKVLILESINAMLIHQGLQQSDRLIQLNAMAITQMRSLVGLGSIKQLKSSQSSK